MLESVLRTRTSASGGSMYGDVFSYDPHAAAAAAAAAPAPGISLVVIDEVHCMVSGGQTRPLEEKETGRRGALTALSILAGADTCFFLSVLSVL
jgi:hypothetical protein